MTVGPLRRLGLHVAASVCGAVVFALTIPGAGGASADPLEPYDPVAHYDQPQRLPVVVPVPSNWQPIFPLHYEDLRRFVTDADINAEREMCQWFEAQYEDVKRHVQGLNAAVVRNNGNFNAPGVPEQTEIVIGNLDQSLAFLGPRALALTQSYDHAGDMYFPIYQGDAFYGLWQQMSNVSNGLKARQPTWFTGPSYQRMMHWGSKIHRSKVCE